MKTKQMTRVKLAVRAFEILATRGLSAMISEVLDYPPIRRRIHELRATILGECVVPVGDIDVDLDHEVISDEMADTIRRNRYETAESELISAHVEPSLPVIDLGAGIGYTSCLIERVTQSSTLTIAVEPAPDLIPVIQRTAELNEAAVELIHAAYGIEGNETEFYAAADFWSSSKYDRKSKNQTKITVPAASLEELREQFDINKPMQLVVDIEGGEEDLFLNEMDLLAGTCALLVVEFHSFTEHDPQDFINIITSNGFERVDSRGSVNVFTNEAFR